MPRPGSDPGPVPTGHAARTIEVIQSRREHGPQYLVERHLPDFPPDQLPGCCGCLPDCGPRLARREFASGEVDHAADAVLRFHQLEAAVDLVERELVRDERVDVDLAGEIAVDELRYLVASLDAAEGRARHAAAGDQEARDDVERLAFARDAADGREAPTHPR